MAANVSPAIARALLAAHHSAYSAHYDSKESAAYRKASDAYYKAMEATEKARLAYEAAQQRQRDAYEIKSAAYEAAAATTAGRNLDSVIAALRDATGERWLEDAFAVLNQIKADEESADANEEARQMRAAEARY